jgi:hypothetical protein
MANLERAHLETLANQINNAVDENDKFLIFILNTTQRLLLPYQLEMLKSLINPRTS